MRSFGRGHAVGPDVADVGAEVRELGVARPQEQHGEEEARAERGWEATLRTVRVLAARNQLNDIE